MIYFTPNIKKDIFPKVFIDFLCSVLSEIQSFLFSLLFIQFLMSILIAAMLYHWTRRAGRQLSYSLIAKWQFCLKISQVSVTYCPFRIFKLLSKDFLYFLWISECLRSLGTADCSGCKQSNSPTTSQEQQEFQQECAHLACKFDPSREKSESLRLKRPLRSQSPTFNSALPSPPLNHLSIHFLNTSRDAESSLLRSLLQCLTSLSGKKFFLISNSNPLLVQLEQEKPLF